MINVESPFDWDIFLLAGVGSTPAIFNDCKRELQQRFHEIDRDPVIYSLFPYGDHTQALWRQLLVVRKDLSRLSKAVMSGAKVVAEQVRQLSTGRPALFIGHSAGGIAAYQAAVMLSMHGDIPDFRVVQVGSPKLPIPSEFSHQVSYFHSVDEHGKSNDPITRIGSWGGWNRNRLGLLYWDRSKYAPGFVKTITVIGGHANYFRDRDPFIHPVRGSNLKLTLNTIWDQMTDEAKPETFLQDFQPHPY
ncbi:hypothetical protein Back11_20000 [Paenibacillus baekrokdamisoli]|uniref:Uncharacterized protein n=1 Tax=Paenibacillus baekrokdamisoli TaxID=1712516 RepID=A0A3G9IWX8_9BACL|nr:hypothetical protein [Paenibacillus baekrokdamisoli]MBB3069995.1 hypothetical protein [Paenibacillus baekrokdamisoli]BBH20655.1 hypothetical protein Back11_20000 [Paenibacillus baekrokdamisoli]